LGSGGNTWYRRRAAQTEQMRSNWAGYGEEIKQLEKVLSELSAQAR
jgi:hypothetical protein